MLDLGKYAFPILASYATSIVLLGGLVWVSMRRQKRIRQALTKQAQSQKQKDNPS